MNDYIPSNDEVRENYVLARDTSDADTDNGAEFDRWLAARDAEIKAAALEEAAEFYRSAQLTGVFMGRDDYPREWLRVRAAAIRRKATECPTNAAAGGLA